MAFIQKLIIALLAFARKNLLPMVFPTPPPQLEYAPDGWNTQLGPEAAKGWNDPAAAREEQEKWDAFCSAVYGTGPLGFCHEHTDLTITRNISFHNIHITFGYVLALASQKKDAVSVLDYGGGFGHYCMVGKALLPEIEIAYHCWEVPVMADEGKRLNPDINWHTGPECLDKTYDLVMISGSLQYVEHWQEFLCDISKAVAPGNYLYLTRVPVIEEAESYVAVQKAFDSRLLHMQFNRRDLLKGVEQAGFEMVREFVVGDSSFILNAPEQFEMRGWLFRKCR